MDLCETKTGVGMTLRRHFSMCSDTTTDSTRDFLHRLNLIQRGRPLTVPVVKRPVPGLNLDLRPTLHSCPVEREKRHYAQLFNVTSAPVYKPRGRRYWPHGHGEDYTFRPHNQALEPQYTECGPDWKSRVRWIPSPHNEMHKPEIWPDSWKPLRTFSGINGKSQDEWSMYPENGEIAKRTKWSGLHKASTTSENEVTHTMLYGKGRNSQVINKRNGLTMASPGDKSYQAVEYSPDFHKAGSTLPLVNFGGSKKHKPDTFIPLLELPSVPRPTYKEQEARRLTEQDETDVKQLEWWRPATPLTHNGPHPPAVQEEHK